jgi:MFS superfamily sulfate permease-like transporter
MAASSLAVGWLDLSIETIGSIPRGLPTFALPNPGSSELGELTLTALALALLAFADTSVLSRSYASRFGESVDQDQELRALGAANFATGFFQGFPISSSSSRTPVAESAGAKTQLACLIGAIGLGVILVFASGLFGNLPAAVLAAIVIAAMISLVDLAGFRRLARVHRGDFLLALTCFVGVALFGVLWGMGISIGLSILAFLWRAWHPYDAVLGRATGVKGYHDLTRYPEAKQIPGLILYRFDAPLFFANATIFRERLLATVRGSAVPVKMVVVAAEPITDLDSTAADMLADLDHDLEAQGIELAFAEMKDPVKDRLRRFGLVERIGHERFYPTIGVAVRRYVEEHAVEWVDWEEAGERLPASSAPN